MIDIFKKRPALFNTVEVDEFKELLAQHNSVLLDVRTTDEVVEGKISEAINLDYYSRNFKQSVDLLDREKTYLVYCRNGGRARKASKLMTEIGFQNVVMLKGGFKVWKK